MSDDATGATPEPSMCVLSGGVGAARFLRGAMAAIDHSAITAVVNTGDDLTLHGLEIAPDLDTITYTLAGAIDPERGWGLAGESWQAMTALARFSGSRPPDSRAAVTWFQLGDRDLATHLYRTARLAEGATPTGVAAEIAAAFGVAIELLPMSDHPVRTIVTLADGGRDVSFQEYFVQLRHDVAVSGVRFAGDGAELTAQATRALATRQVVVIAPSNPLVSIAPIRSLPGVDHLLTQRRSSVVAVSPIVGGRALKGPADRMLTELGLEQSVVGVARLYAGVAATLVIDVADRALAPAVEDIGMGCIVTETVMTSAAVAADLARTCLAAGQARSS